MTDATRGHAVVRLRLSPTLADDVGKYADDNGETNQSAVLRDLVRKGLEAEQSGRTVKPRLRREQYAERAAGLVDALGDVLQQIERHDPQGAVLLSAGLVRAVNGYHEDLTKRAKK